MLIAAISDTHIPDKAHRLPESLLAYLGKVDLILHAGDLTSAAVLDQLRVFAPVEAVAGNVDDSLLRHTLPRSRVVQADGVRIGLVHGDGQRFSTAERALRAFTDVECVVFGHSHMPLLERKNGVILLNPGSPTDKRRSPRPSFALIHVEKGLRAEIVYL